MPPKQGKLVLIGAGMVGAATLNALLMMNLISEVAVIDQNMDRARGEAFDASHTTAFAYSTNADIHAGSYEDCRDAAVIVMTAGPSIKPGEKMDRRILAKQNISVMTSVMEQITAYTTDAIIIAVTNPVDVITYCAQTRFAYPENRIFGTGTLLDTARLREMIAKRCGIDSKNVHGYVLGEHGESAFVPWSLVNVAGIPFHMLPDAFGLAAPLDAKTLVQATKDAGFDILQLKGYTSAGIAMSVCRLVKAILLNEHCILPVSTMLGGCYGISDVAMSVPCVIAREGRSHIVEVPLTNEEHSGLHQCAAHLAGALQDAGLQ